MFRHADLITQNIMSRQCYRIAMHLAAETGAAAHYSTSSMELLMPGIPKYLLVINFYLNKTKPRMNVRNKTVISLPYDTLHLPLNTPVVLSTKS